MKAFVTGANGFVGAALCRKLVEKGVSVIGLTRATSDLSLIEDLDIERVVGSLEERRSLESASKEADVVYHTASAVTDWGTLDMYRRVNVEGTLNVLEASVRNGVRRFVYVSSAAVHSFSGARDMDENSPMLHTPFPYCQTKREAEDVVLRYHHMKGLEVCIIRPGDVYGPGDRVSLLRMAKRLESGRMALIRGGDTLGAFTYVENLADALVLAGRKKEADGEAFVITDGIKRTWREYFDRLTAELGVPPVKRSVSPRAAYGLATVLEWFYRAFRVKNRPPVTRYLVTHLRGDFHFSIDKARAILDYSPGVDFEEAVRRTAAWYKKVVRGGA